MFSSNIRHFNRLFRSQKLNVVTNNLTKLLSQTSESNGLKVDPSLADINQSLGRQVVPRRALLYCPGNDERKIAKLATIANTVDSVVLDCEDGVALNKKSEARHTIKESLQTLNLGRTECAVRINSIDSGFADEDLKVIFSSEITPKTILLPKVESKEHLDSFCEKLVKALGKRKIEINLITYVESAKGLLNLKDVVSHAIELSEFHLFDLEGIVFGSDDFCASIGATRTSSASEVMMARQQVVVTAKAFDLQAIDVVYIDYKDLEGLKQQSEEGYKMGFTGKQAIHPTQVSVIEKAFTPSEEKIEWATKLINEFNKYQNEGKGAFVFEGQMIDRPLLLQAMNIVNIANAIKIN